MTDSLVGWDAPVTGAVPGLGRGVARALARAGMRVWLAGLRGEVGGCRFNARGLTEALERGGPDGVSRTVHQLDEGRSALWS
jgi:NAD(P)-dependent dehydrogenase (short-subunit alcohol dehydrogenase family)